eukprot:2850734-Prymnesium_polylepis.1
MPDPGANGIKLPLVPKTFVPKRPVTAFSAVNLGSPYKMAASRSLPSFDRWPMSATPAKPS